MVVKLNRSATKGKPDNSSLDFSSRISSLNDMMDTTSKPLIFDADNGGQLEHLPFLVRSLERSGVSAIIMEDKVGLKKIHFSEIKRIPSKTSLETSQKNKKYVIRESQKISW